MPTIRRASKHESIPSLSIDTSNYLERLRLRLRRRYPSSYRASRPPYRPPNSPRPAPLKSGLLRLAYCSHKAQEKKRVISSSLTQSYLEQKNTSFVGSI